MDTRFMEAEKVVKIAKPADLIEIKRRFYKHWAIYVGGGEIVHFASNTTASLLTMRKALIKREKLMEAAKFHRCRVNNRLDDKYPVRDPNVIVSDALRSVGQEVKYSVENWNCEHFVTGLRYYKPESGQVERATIFGFLGWVALLLFSLIRIAVAKIDEEETERRTAERLKQPR